VSCERSARALEIRQFALLSCCERLILTPCHVLMHMSSCRMEAPLHSSAGRRSDQRDAEVHTIDMDVSEAALSTRRNSWKAPPLKATQGFLYKYIKNVSTASLGRITDA
jgi:hypothetical protein